MGRGQLYQWTLSAETIEAILWAVEWPIPFHLNLVFEELRAVVSEGHGAPSPSLVETALQRLMAHGRTHFDHWDERLAKMLDSRCQGCCEIILSLACREADGVTVASIDLRLSSELQDHRERAEMLRCGLGQVSASGTLAMARPCGITELPLDHTAVEWERRPPMSQVTFSIPDEILLALKATPEILAARIRIAAAVKLYEMGRVPPPSLPACQGHISSAIWPIMV